MVEVLIGKHRLQAGVYTLDFLTGCSGKPAETKHRMISELSKFAARLRELILQPKSSLDERQFGELALELFALQFAHNTPYRGICAARGVSPKTVEHWTQTPAIPTSAFKELELSSIPASERTAVFHSSGTTEQRPSRHFHNATSLRVYETSLWRSFEQQAIADLRFTIYDLRVLTPPPKLVPHSSLVHMFEAIREKLGADESVFLGDIGPDNAWTLDFARTFHALETKASNQLPKLILGTAFSFVHLLDFLEERNLRLELPVGSRVMETGGYKGRSRTMPKAELHALITERLGVPQSHILCEYGMSELSSQAYQTMGGAFHFPPWARAQIVSPETGRAVANGETGLLRIFDLANVFSVMAIQTEDLALCRNEGFELVGRAQLAEARGCSLMTA